MFLVPQGQNQAKRIAELEARVQALENLVKGLQEKNARIGRPPKEKVNDKENFGYLSNQK